MDLDSGIELPVAWMNGTSHRQRANFRRELHRTGLARLSQAASSQDGIALAASGENGSTWLQRSCPAFAVLAPWPGSRAASIRVARHPSRERP